MARRYRLRDAPNTNRIDRAAWAAVFVFDVIIVTIFGLMWLGNYSVFTWVLYATYSVWLLPMLSAIVGVVLTSTLKTDRKIKKHLDASRALYRLRLHEVYQNPLRRVKPERG